MAKPVKQIVRKYRPEPSAEEFHADNSIVRGIGGPVGSGKSVSMCLEIYFRALDMPPSRIDNMRKFRAAVIRNTYGELKSTTIKTWQDWMPQANVVYDTPIRWNWRRQNIGDGTGIDMEVLFLALDRPDDVKKLLSLELTMGWINEAKEEPYSVLTKLRERCGRYPSKVDVPSKEGPDGKPLSDEDGNEIPGYWSGVILDTNMPDQDHWWYRLAEIDRPAGFRFWHQPPALIQDHAQGGKWVANKGQFPGIPPAENVQNQPKGWAYYLDLVPGASADYIKVFLGAQYGFVTDGKPVFPEYVDSLHCSESVEPIPGLPIVSGQDFGLTPAAVLGQRLPNGRWIVFDELTTENMGIVRFANELKPLISGTWGKFPFKEGWGDPAGVKKSEADEQTCFGILQANQLPIGPSPDASNNFTRRREAVASLLTRIIDGKPGLMIHPRCKVLRQGLSGGYHLRRVLVSGSERFKDEPDKDKYSHVCEAAQYMLLGAGEGYSLTSVAPSEAFVPTRRHAQYHTARSF